ncbi:MAG TPA: ABC transporter permease [Blastocatellia bacterium]|nr:ABC transporter permease [Blastocatellia bacterium]
MGFREPDHRSSFRPYLWLIKIVSLIVPARLRPDWRREWISELQHREARLRTWRRLDWRARLDLVKRSLGAFSDALWYQGHRWEDEMIQDLRYGIRMLLGSPVFTAVAVLSLALGVGANTAIFSLVNAVLLESLPVKNPDQLILLRWVSGPKVPANSISGFFNMAGGSPSSTSFGYSAFQRLRDQNDLLTDMVAFAEMHRLNVSIDGQAELISGQVVTGNYYAGLGVGPVLGRVITDDDDKESSEAVAVISYGYWRRRFAADPGVAGKVIYLNGSPFTIIGVTPAGFHGTLGVGVSPDVTIPAHAEPLVKQGSAALKSPGDWWLQIIGRLKPGATPEQAQAQLDSIFQQEVAEIIASSKEEKDMARLEVLPGSQGLTETREGLSEPLFIMVIVVALVLAIACANIANLLLARAEMRRKEIAVRLALGATRFRLIRQLLTESLLLASLGGALGLLIVYWSRGLILTLLPGRSDPLNLDVDIDIRVLGFTAAVSILTGVLFGLAPALRATRVDPSPALKDSSGSVTRARSRLSKALLVTQVALSLLLLIGAGLFVRTLQNLESVDLGFNSRNLLVFKMDPTLNGYKGERLASLYQQLKERIETIPGVESVSLSRYPLVSNSASISRGDDQVHIYIQHVSSNFFETMQIPLLVGRTFTDQDSDKSTRVAIINEAYARHYFPEENPIGRRFKLGRGPRAQELEVVGLARDARYSELRERIPPTVYLPYLQGLAGLREMAFEVRTVDDPNKMIAMVRQAAQDVESNVPLFAVSTQQEIVDKALTQERLFARVSSLFSVLALVLASIGLYGIMSYSVARRTHEIGIRMALGARGSTVRWLVLRESLLMIVIGVILGLGAGLAATQVIASMLFGLTATDPLTIAVAMVFLVSVTAFAGYLPARRASKVDPMIALRYE